MLLKLMDLNIQKGRLLDEVIKFIKENDFDVIHLQEVTSGILSYDQKTDCFEKILQSIPYQGFSDHHWSAKSYPNSFLSNASFFKKNILIRRKEIVWLKNFQETIDPFHVRWEEVSRAALSITVDFNGQIVNFINTHLAWSPRSNDEPHKLAQGKILVNYLQNLKNPFILSGDFNVDPQTKLVSYFNKIGKNLTIKNQVTNTLNPHLHVAREVFPKGIAVDYIFISKDLTAQNFKVIDHPDLSDHLGLAVEIKL